MTAFMNEFGIILYATLIYTPPLLYAALGSCFSEVSGVVNIGIEGMMTAGAFTGTVGGLLYRQPLSGLFVRGPGGHALRSHPCLCHGEPGGGPDHSRYGP